MEEGLVGFVSGKEWTRHDPVDDDWRGNRDWLIGIGGKLGDSPAPDGSIDEIAAVVKHRPVSSSVSRSLLPSLCPFLFIQPTTKRLNLAFASPLHPSTMQEHPL